MNCVQLSATIVSRIPNLGKISYKNLIVPLHILFLHFITSGYFKKLSISIKSYYPFIRRAKSICSLDQSLSVFGQWVNFSGDAFAAIIQPLHDFTFSSIFCPYLDKKYSFSLKLSSLLYHDDWYENLSIFFVSALLVSPPIHCTSKLHQRWKKIFSLSVFLYCWLIICFFFSMIYLSIFSLFLISSIVAGNSHMVLQKTLFISNLRIAFTVSSNCSHSLRINWDNLSTCPNFFDRRNNDIK